MDVQSFDKLLGIVRPRLRRYSIREPVSAQERLMVTLSYLANGTSFRRLAYIFRLGRSTVGNIVKDTCNAICDLMYPEYMKTPSTEDEWLAIADGFWRRWNLPNTLGAIDGKHIAIKKPPASGTLYHNYKGGFSIVLMAVCDHRYRIIYAKFGDYGHESDGGIFDRSDFKHALDNDLLHLPLPAPLPGTNIRMPHFFVGDAAFPL
ncbi:hypothetical protein AAVH_18793 [Aphelenchoides avenae]|nr:hypothetical protein AAVH_18793 [Aphelenchus avenae]